MKEKNECSVPLLPRKKNNQRSLYILGLCIVLLLTLDYINISYKLIGLNFLTAQFSASKAISSAITAIIASIMAIVFAVYIVLIQLFRHRYPIDFIDAIFHEKISFISYNYVTNIVYGLLLTFIDNDMPISKVIYLGHVLYCLYLFSKLFQDYKVFNVTQVLKSHKNSIIKQIEIKGTDCEQILICLKELGKYSEESFVKQELYLAKYISFIYRDLIFHFIENKDKIIINGQLSEDDINTIEKNLFKAILTQIRLSVNYEYKNYLAECISIVEEVLKTTIKCDKVETFKNFSNLLDISFNYHAFHKSTTVGIYVISLYGDLAAYALSKKLREEWIKLFKEKLKYYCFASTIHLDESVLKVLFGEYFSFIGNSLKEKSPHISYKDELKQIKRLYLDSSGECNSSVANFVQALFHKHVYDLLELPNNSQQFEDFMETVYDIGWAAFNNNNKEQCLFVLSLFDQITDSDANEKIKETVSQHKYNLSLKAIYFNSDLSALFLPDYARILKKNPLPDTTKTVVEQYQELLYRTVLRKNTDLILYFLNEINELVLLFPREKKLEQTSFIELYEYIIEFSLEIKSEEIFQITLHKYTDLIKAMDKENKISHDLFHTVINVFDTAIDKAIHDKQIGACLSINGSVLSLIKSLNIIARNKELYFEAVELLFQTGLKGIENNDEDIIRNVSNYIGWTCKKAIEQNETDRVRVLLNKASQLYNLAVDFGIDERTLIFIGTLFIILGGYSCSINNQWCIMQIVTSIRGLKKLEILNKSRAIREYESATWNKYMKNDAKGSIESFWRKVNEKHRVGQA